MEKFRKLFSFSFFFFGYLRVFRANIVPEPPGKEYGCCFRKTCPTRLQGTISKRPPHCQVRNDISVCFLTKKSAKKSVISERHNVSGLQFAPTEILTTPNIHLKVIRTKCMEVLAVNDKESSGNHRRPYNIFIIIYFLNMLSH